MNDLIGRKTSIGAGQMNLETFIETATRHPQVLRKTRVSEKEASWAWHDNLTYDVKMAIRATTYRLADLQQVLNRYVEATNLGYEQRQVMLAAGYQGGPAGLEAALKGRIFEESIQYLQDFSVNFADAHRFYCESDIYTCA